MVYLTEFGAFGMHSVDGRYVEDDDDDDVEDGNSVTLLPVPALLLSSSLPLELSFSLS